MTATQSLLNEMSISIACPTPEDASRLAERLRALEDAWRQHAAVPSTPDARFRALIEHATEAIALLDGQGRFLYASPASARINGYPLDEFVGQDAFSIIHPDDLPAVMEAFNRLVQDPDVPVHAQYRLQHAEGHWIWIDAVACNRLTDPVVGALVVNYRDSTAAMQAHEELEAQVLTRTAELAAANAALREAEALAHLGHWERDCATGSIRWSDEVYRIFGLQRQPMTMDDLLQCVHPDDRHLLTAMTLASSPQTVEHEYRVMRPDDSIRVVYCVGSSLYDEEDRPLRVFGTIQDITERKQAETALRDSEEQLRLVTEASPAGMFIWQNGHYVFVNEAAIRMTGNPRERWLTLSLPDLVPTEYVAMMTEYAHRRLAGLPAPERYEIEYLTSAGERRWADFASRVIQYHGSPAILSNAIDITERVQTETRLKELLAEMERRAAELDTIINAIADAVLVYGPQGELLRVNAAARAMTGYSESEMAQSITERTAALRICTQDGTRVRPEDTPAARALRGETIYNTIISFTTVGGAKMWTSASAAPIRAADGTILGAVVSLSDMTEQQQLQQRQEEFLHLVSHDLRIPLTIIQGHTQVLVHALDATLNDRSRACLTAIERSARRMNVMIEDLVDLARIEGGRFTLHPEAVPLERFLPDLCRRLTGTLDMDRVTLDVPAALPPVIADPDRLERILVNLLSNALKYSPPDAPVVLRAGVDGAGATLAVIDRGIGIAPEALPRLFDRFYRVDTPRHAEGLGLGLYITRLLVDAHGGAIQVDSAPGAGSTFTVRLPLSAPPE